MCAFCFFPQVKFSSISFDRQERGFFYCRYPPPASLAAHAGMDAGSEVDAASGQALYYHRLRTPQSADRLVCAVGEHPSWMFGAEVTECGRWAVVTVSEGCDPVNKVWLLDMSAQDPAVATTVDAAAAAPFQLDKIIDTFEAGFDYIGNDEHVFYFKTNHSAPRYRLVAIDIQNPQPEHWRELVPQHAKDVLNWVACVGGAAAAQTQLLCCHTRDVKEVLTLRPLQGAENNDRVFELPLPGPGEISGVGARRKDKEFFYSFTSFTHPAVIFHHSLDVTVSTVWREVTVGSLDPKKFQVFVIRRYM